MGLAAATSVLGLDIEASYAYEGPTHPTSRKDDQVRHSTSIPSRLRALACCAAVAGWATSAMGVTLIEDGRARCVIIVRLEDEPILDAAEDLQYHLRKMSGAEVPIVHDVCQYLGRFSS